MAGGAAPPPKQDELQPHPVKDQLPNISYCITSPPPWRKFAPLFLLCLLTLFLFIASSVLGPVRLATYLPN
jgi:solute carrier family 23 (nucleobase transporter), member 1